MGGWSVEIDPACSHGRWLAPMLDHGRPPASLGLSHRSSASNRGRLAATLDWLGPRVGELAVVEGSYLARWNRMALDGASEGEASRHAASEAIVVRRRIERLLEERCSDSSRYLDWADLLGTPEVRETIGALEDFARADPAFGAALREEIGDFVARTRGASPESLPAKTRDFLGRYVIEEAAVLLGLQHRGYVVEVYHGPDLPLVGAIAGGRFPGLAVVPCPERTHVSLRFTRTAA